MDPTKQLTPMQERFCQEYIKDKNGTQSAIRAGFKKSSAGQQATQLLKREKVKNRIRDLMDSVLACCLVDAEYVVSGLMEVAERCLKPEPIMCWDSVKRCRVQKKDKEGRLVWSFDSSGAVKAFELLGKYVGIFNKDNLQQANEANTNSLTDDQFSRLLDEALKGKSIKEDINLIDKVIQKMPSKPTTN